MFSCFCVSDGFDTEAEAERKKKEKLIQDNKEKGIWNMKFMKEAENKRRESLKALTKAALNAHGFGELDQIERAVNKIEEDSHSVDPLVQKRADDDPIGIRRHEKWLKKQETKKAEEIHAAQTILGKENLDLVQI